MVDFESLANGALVTGTTRVCVLGSRMRARAALLALCWLAATALATLGAYTDKAAFLAALAARLTIVARPPRAQRCE